MFEIEYSHENNVNWSNIIQDIDDQILLYNFTEPYSLYPISGDLNPTSIFYYLIKLNRNVKIIDSDINLRRNYNLVKDKLNSNLDLDLNFYPWYFMNNYFFRDKYKCHKKYDLKYNSIFLLGGHKMCRIYILLELSNYKNLLFSNLGWVHNDFVKFANVKNHSLVNDKFTLDTDKGKFTFKGDDSVDSFKFENNYFDSHQKIYFDVDETAYEKVPKTEPIFLYELAPDQYMESCFSFFCETQTEYASSLTEKTIKNLFYKKPFLGFACDGFYKFLKNNGFELYDEIFDYSFDEYSYGDRLNNYIGECKKVLDLSLDESINLVDKLKPKILHNYENCKTILKNSMLNMNLKYINNNLSVKV